ncbi:hypothetical protein ABG768_017678 [Culter alburnus]|uniref:BHLH domain-containing protein n=1 Tax=Culter alburnus TaxID=194366 RepID=A0AAW1YTP0_CULAL
MFSSGSPDALMHCFGSEEVVFSPSPKPEELNRESVSYPSPGLPRSPFTSTVFDGMGSSELWSSANGSSPSAKEGMLGNSAQPGNCGDLASHDRLNTWLHSDGTKRLPSMSCFHRGRSTAASLSSPVGGAECCTAGANHCPQPTGVTSLLANYEPALVEDRLDEAIHVLRNHAVGVTNADLTNDLRSLFGQTPHGPIASIAGSMASRSSAVSESAALAIHSSVSQPTADLTNQSDRCKGLISHDASVSLQLKSEVSEVEELLMRHVTRVSSDDASDTQTAAGDTGTRTSSVHEDEDVSPEQKAERERERRMANNARERLRVRDINEAFQELGRVCQIHLKNDKPQTKLLVLHQAVDVILSLEQQVRERSLNPVCLRRTEELKSSSVSLNLQYMIHDFQNNVPGHL